MCGFEEILTKNWQNKLEHVFSLFLSLSQPEELETVNDLSPRQIVAPSLVYAPCKSIELLSRDGAAAT